MISEKNDTVKKTKKLFISIILITQYVIIKES